MARLDTNLNGTAFSSQLRQLRQAAGLTQGELAERAGLTVAGVSALERGHRRRPYAHTVRALATALGLTPGQQDMLLTEARRGATPIVTSSVAGADRTPARPTLPRSLTSFIGRARE